MQACVAGVQKICGISQDSKTSVSAAATALSSDLNKSQPPTGPKKSKRNSVPGKYDFDVVDNLRKSGKMGNEQSTQTNGHSNGVSGAHAAGGGGGPSIFAHMKQAPVDPILGTSLAFKADNHPSKVNLGIGAYRTENGKPFVLRTVLKAEEAMMRDQKDGSMDKEYSPVDGLAGLKPLCQKLIFGKAEARIASTQALSGTGSLRVTAEFIRTHLGCEKIFYSDPTWGNHIAIFREGGITPEKYPYWNAEKKCLDYEGMTAHLEAQPDYSLYLIQPNAQNPTGVDPSTEQWRKIIEICRRKNHIVVLDSAYQGYATGDVAVDRKAIEMFMGSEGPNTGVRELFCCQSFAKNFGLYGERIGMLHIVCQDAERAKVVISQVKLTIRAMYSSPPIHGAHIVHKILSDDGPGGLYEQWTGELKMMSERIGSMRHALRSGLEKKGTPGTWHHITDQIGMFSFTGLTKAQCERVIEKHHVYMLKTGRISLAGLTEKNVQHVVDSFDEVVRNA